MSSVVDIRSAPSRRAQFPMEADPREVAAQVAAGQRLYTADELGRLLHVSTRSIRRDRAAGMPSVPVGRQGVRYVLSHVLAWQRQRREHESSPRSA